MFNGLRCWCYCSDLLLCCTIHRKVQHNSESIINQSFETGYYIKRGKCKMAATSLYFQVLPQRTVEISYIKGPMAFRFKTKTALSTLGKAAGGARAALVHT